MSSTPAERLLGTKVQVTPPVTLKPDVLPPQWDRVTHEKHGIGTANLKTSFRDAIPLLVTLEDLLDNLRGRLRGAECETLLNTDGSSTSTRLNRLRWSNRIAVARSLSWQLGTRSLLLTLRRAYIAAVGGMQNAVNQFKNDTHGPSGRIASTRYRRRSGYTKWGEPHTSEIVRPDEFFSKAPHPDIHACAYYLNQRWNNLVNQATLDYQEARQLLELPDYMRIKQLMPKGGREAYSALTVCQTGSTESTKQCEHSLFGWYSSDYGDLGDRLQGNLKRLCRQLAYALEEKPVKGQRLNAPSWAAGREALRKSLPAKMNIRMGGSIFQRKAAVMFTQLNDAPTNYDGDFPIAYDKPRMVRQAILCAHASGELFTPQIMYLIRYPQYSKYEFVGGAKERAKAHAIVRKVMKVNSEGRLANDVPTMLTGRVQHAIGSDYFAQCIYGENVRWTFSPHPITGSNLRPATKEGYILLRQGWPDMYHLERSHHLLPPTPQEVVEILDRASSAYFEAQRRQAEDDAKEKLTMNQRIARLLKKLRALPQLNKNDSYHVGNCTGGTQAFIDQLQSSSGLAIDDGIQGRILAKCWRKAQYKQIDRFASVVEYLYKLVEAEQKQRIMDGNPEVAVHTQYGAEYIARSEERNVASALAQMQQEAPAIEEVPEPMYTTAELMPTPDQLLIGMAMSPLEIIGT